MTTPILLNVLVMAVLTFLAGCLVGYAFTKPDRHMAQVIVLAWQMAHYLKMDPEAADLVAEWERLMGRGR